jgi:hypothetical protein
MGSPNPYFENDKVIFLSINRIIMYWKIGQIIKNLSHTGEIIITKSWMVIKLSIEQNSTSKRNIIYKRFIRGK